MSLTIQSEPVPLSCDADGVVRVAGTRVTLDTIVGTFNQGTAPEKIAEQYPTVSLSQVYAVLGYYLGHREQVERYLEERCRGAAAVQRENQGKYDAAEIRNRLLKRRGEG